MEPTLVRHGHRGNADILEGEIGGVPVIVKDWTRKGYIVRALVAPLSVRRERRAYEALAGLSGIARVLSAERLRLSVARIDGVALSSCAPGSVPAETFASLARLVSAMHARGIVHLDLNHRGNVLLDASGQPWLIDLAAAIDLRALRGLGRYLARRIGFFDRAAVAKWKSQLCPDPLTESEARDVRLLYVLRRFWLLNPKTR